MQARPKETDRRRQENRKRRNRWAAKRYRARQKKAKRIERQLARATVDDIQIITGYADLVDYLVARRKALGLTQEQVDERAGFTARYCSKLEAWTGPQGRVAGAVSLPLWLEALGVRLRPITEPPPATKRPRLNGAEIARRPRAEACAP